MFICFDKDVIEATVPHLSRTVDQSWIILHSKMYRFMAGKGTAKFSLALEGSELSWLSYYHPRIMESHLCQWQNNLYI